MTRRFQISAWFWICLATFAAHRVSAQTPADHAKDEAAVRQAGNEYRAAASRGDARATAEFWTTNGSFTDLSGQTVKVRDLPTASKAENNPAASVSAGLNV